MRLSEIETWALSVIERLKDGQPIEDSRVELKAAFIRADQAARRLAGHANAARGESILWLIGVDERARSVRGVDAAELANWFHQLESCFESAVPSMTDRVVFTDGLSVLALLFDTSYAPYVVKATSGLLEVPWREGTAVRSARREDLIRILVPIMRAPSVEVTSADLSLVSDGNVLSWHLTARLYVVPVDEARVVIPFHRCRGSLDAGTRVRMEFDEIALQAPRAQYGKADESPYITATSSEIIVGGPGHVHLRAKACTQANQDQFEGSPAKWRAGLAVINIDAPVGVGGDLIYRPPKSKSDRALAHWEMTG